MSRFAAFEDRELDRRLQRLTRSELELQARIKSHAAQAEGAGCYAAADPAYQRLAATLRTVREALHETAQEQLRRRSGTNPSRRSHMKRGVLPASGRTSGVAARSS